MMPSDLIQTPSRSIAKAKLELALLNAEAQSVSSSDLYAWLKHSGLPDEVAIRLYSFTDTIRKIGDVTISLGKILIIKIIDFSKRHPNLATGVAIGAAIGALVGLIPFLGAYLAPVAVLLGVGIGAVTGHRMDRVERGELAAHESKNLMIAEDIIRIAKEFFRLIADVFNTFMDSQPAA